MYILAFSHFCRGFSALSHSLAMASPEQPLAPNMYGAYCVLRDMVRDIAYDHKLKMVQNRPVI